MNLRTSILSKEKKAVIAFEELLPESQEFLKKHGINPEGDHADFWYSIKFITHFIAYFYLPHEELDTQIQNIALSSSINTEALDDNKIINMDFQSVSEEEGEPVNYRNIDLAIGVIDLYIRKKIISQSKNIKDYKTFDIELIKKNISFSNNDEIILKNRNELWLGKFMEANKEYESIFVAVGLTHLIGAYNFLDMLEANGFFVERMACFE